MKIRALFLALALSTGAIAAHATPITYDIDRTVVSGSVIGTLTTDGTIGVLTAANIIGWSLAIDNGRGGGAYTLNDDSLGQLSLTGALLSATLTSLNFDFSGSGGYLLIGTWTSATNWWCIEGNATRCTTQGVGETLSRPTGVPHQVYGDSQTIGIAEGAGTIPEPGSIALLGLAFAGMATVRRHVARSGA